MMQPGLSKHTSNKLKHGLSQCRNSLVTRFQSINWYQFLTGLQVLYLH